jgi:lipopolysaccharide transport system ATP-binding protein
MSDFAIKVENVSKAYTIWRDPSARLKHPFLDLAGELFPALRPRIDRKMQGLCTEFYALRDVSFEVRKGESVGIIGRNGSGKSTLLQIIAGTLQPTEGSVTVNGRVAALLELGSGFNPEFTGRENVYLNCSILGLTKEETEARFDSIAEFADIGEFLEQPVKTYSSGMTMRLAFSVSVHIKPDILIVDEALAVGDIFFIQKCISKIKSLQQEGCSIIFVTHSMNDIISLCEKALLIRNGKLEYIGASKTAVDLYDYSEAFNNSENYIAKEKPRFILKKNNNADANILSKCYEAKNATINDSKKTELHFIKLFRINGEESERFESGEMVYIMMGFTHHEDLSDPAGGFKIRDLRGQVIYETSSHALGYQLPAADRNQLYVVGFAAELPLYPGDYTITAGFANGRIGKTEFEEVLLYQHDVKKISILENTKDQQAWAGICNIYPKIIVLQGSC